jgi:uncharacterized cysteine cluster protein YcgN (CxxCxxCC family)
MNKITWENICRRCGECCFEKWIEEDDRIRFTRIPCRHLDIVTRECRVYHKRFDVGEGCIKLTPEVVRTSRWLPEGCAYRSAVASLQEESEINSDSLNSSSQRLPTRPSRAE